MDERWSGDELDLLEEFYPKKGPSWDKWPELLPGRSNQAVRAQAGRLCAVRVRRWSAKEEDLLRKLLLAFSAKTGRKPRSVAYKAYNLLRYGKEFR